MQDRRDLGRWTLYNKVCYRKTGEEKECECRSEDISSHGIRLATNEALVPQTELNLLIHLAEDLNPVTARGKVVWQATDQNSPDKHFNTGIYFEDIKDPDRDEIFKYAYQYKRNEVVNRWWQGW